MISRALLQKFRDGNCTPDELAIIESFLDQNVENQLTDLLREDWQETDISENPELADAANAAQIRVWQQFDENLQIIPPVEKAKSSWHIRRWFLAAACTGLLLLFGAGWYLNHSGEKSTFTIAADGSTWITKENLTGKKVNVKLNDGTLILLSENSKISFPEHFEKKARLVRLSGEAFFDVHRDTLRPFTIQTANLRVQVLGTSFNVSETNGKSEVAVKSGKVMVASLKSEAKIYLGPNERASADIKNGNLSKTLVAIPEIVIPELAMNRFEFNDTPVSKVFELLHEAYRVDIIYDKTVIGNCPITARLTDQPLFTKLDMICASIGVSYHLENEKILIEGPGCNE